jgi:hypothetical protein
LALPGSTRVPAAGAREAFLGTSSRPVEAVLVDDETYAAGLVEHAGMPEPVAHPYTTFGTGTRRGYSGALSATVAELTGGTPTSARDAAAADRGLAPRAGRLA